MPLIADLLNSQQRFLRSTHLGRDFQDPTVLDGYIVTPAIESIFERIMNGIALHSGARAWRITGDYGSGKSTLALLLAHLFFNQQLSLSPRSHNAGEDAVLPTQPPRLFPILVTCVREPLATSLIRALDEMLRYTADIAALHEIRTRLQTILMQHHNDDISDNTALAMLYEVLEAIAAAGIASGLLLVLDELGKFLEYAALHPHRQDVLLLQRLAETAARSGQQPLTVVGILHQGFHAYSDQLAQTTQREWEKVAGRFEEIVFEQNDNAIVRLTTEALKVHIDDLPAELVATLRQEMREACHLNWYGSDAPVTWLESVVAAMYPLHPLVLPVLMRIFTRFGQNERSLFSFLLAREPFGLQEFANQPFAQGMLFRLHHLYDYVRTTFGHRISQQSYRSQWHLIESIITSYAPDNELELQILKTIGILNLVDVVPLLPTKEAILLALSPQDEEAASYVEAALLQLRQQKHLIHYRGRAGGYCLWPYTSVNLENVYEQAHQVIGSQVTLSKHILTYLEPRPLVARRHYIQTGTLRYFDVQYVPMAQLASSLQTLSPEGAGTVLLPLCETAEECQQALQFAHSPAMMNYPSVLLAVSPPLTDLAGLLHELQCWQWVQTNTPELVHDTYAAQEVLRKVTTARHKLDARLQSSIGLHAGNGPLEVSWFNRGEQVSILHRRHLLEYLSTLCDQRYNHSPRIVNELVNRDVLSSAAAAARMALVEHILASPEQPWLGMNPRTTPPEMSMYLSVCQKTGLHREQDGRWQFCEPPPEDDPSQVRFAFQCIHTLLETHFDEPVDIATIFATLRQPPLGIRDGLAPILLAIYWTIHQHELALYENGTFLRTVQGLEFRRLIKWPATFALQLTQVTETRIQVLDALGSILDATGQRQATTLLNIVHPLIMQAAHWPEYTRKTSRVSRVAQAVRIAIITAKEPAPLVFRDLPSACGIVPILGEYLEPHQIQEYAHTLATALDELRNAYPLLTDTLRVILTESMGQAESLSELRSSLAKRADSLVTLVGEPRLKTLCFRFMDTHLPDTLWLESLGSFVRAKVMTAWSDSDSQQCLRELRHLCEQFRRTEATVFSEANTSASTDALRLTMTHSSGEERDCVIVTNPVEEEAIAEIETHLLDVIQRAGHLGVVAASRAFWQLLTHDEEVEA